MAKAVGKIFEEDLVSSIDKERFLVHRLKDSAQSFNKSALFAWDNPCDFFVYSPTNNILFPIEAKSTKSKSFTFDDPNGTEKESKMVKRHQILSLRDFARYRGVFPMFLFNFRELGENKEQCTYAQHIDDFMRMIDEIDKKSFNVIDIIMHGGIKIDGTKKRTRYRWELERFFDSQSMKQLDKEGV